MARLTSGPAIAVVLTALVLPPALAAGNDCQPAVNERLARMNIDPGDVRSISLQAITQSRAGGNRVTGFDAWIKLKSCRGAIVMRMSRQCRIKEVYSRGECRLPDVPHF